MEYKQERFALNKLCEFRDRDVEAEFMVHEKNIATKTSRFLLLIMGFSFVLFAFSDYFFYGAGEPFFISLGLRIAALLITVTAFVLVNKFTRYDHVLLIVALTELVVFVFYLFILYSIKGSEPARQFMSVVLFLLAVFFAPNRWKNSLVVGCVIWVGYIIFSFVFDDPAGSSPLVQQSIYLGFCLLFCVVFAFDRERSRRKQYATEKLLEFMSVTDKLTGIYNRARFELVLGQWIKNSRHDPFSLLLFDIDDFKKVNDRFGHVTGDRVLVETTEIVSANIRDDDIFARWGGEEFVVLVSCINIEKAADLAERVRKAVEKNPMAKAERITISIGVAQYRRGETITDLVNRADEKMYEAKKAGKNRVVVADI